MAGTTVQTIEGILLVSLTDDETASGAEDVLALVGSAVADTLAQGVLIDVAALSLVDSYTARKLALLVGMARILGSAAVITGIRPDVAIAMVELGIDLPEVATAASVDVGLATLRHRGGTRR